MVNFDATLVDLLAQHGIRNLRSYAASHTERVTCPRCEGGRTKEKSVSITIDQDGCGAVFECKRGTCSGFKGGVRVRIRRAEPEPQPRQPDGPPEPPPEREPDWFYAFWDARHIGAATLAHFGIYSSHWKFERVGRRPCMVFPYRWKHQTVGYKYRAYPEKLHSQSASQIPTLFNADAINPDEPLIWVEGEPDVLAMYEAGFRNVVSLRDGAPQKVGQGDRRFAALATHAEVLAKVPYHILAGDMDEAGEAWCEELARRLGKHRVRLVTWPEGCKDVSDVLRTVANRQAFGDSYEPNNYEKFGIRRAISNAVPYPIEGVRRLDTSFVERAMSRQDAPVMRMDLLTTDAHSGEAISFPTEGKLIVITGVPSHGKTAFTRFVAMHTIEHHQRRWLVFSSEEDSGDFVRDCAQIILRKRRHELTAADTNAVVSVLEPALQLLEMDSERNPATIDNLLERAIFTVLRDGVTDLLLDPWNEIEFTQDGDVKETNHIGRCLQRLKAFASEYGCNVWVVCHPAKPPPLRSGEKRRPPTGFDIAGSANFINKSDLGLTVWRSDIGKFNAGKTEIRVWKSRRKRWATVGKVAVIEFDDATCRYRVPATADAAHPWSDADD